MAVQGSLFPFSSPATVLAHLERIQRTIVRLAPDMPSSSCLRILSELALLEAVLDAQELHIRHMVTLQAKRLALI